MTTIDRRIHGFKRRINTQALGTKTINNSEDTILDSIRLLCSQIQPSDLQTWSQPLDLGERLRWLTFDIMADVTFGESWNMIMRKDNRWILEMLPVGVSMINMVGTPDTSIRASKLTK